MATTIDTSGLRRSVASRGDLIARRLTIDLDRELRDKARPHRKTGEMERAINVTHSRISPTTWRIVADVPVIQASTTDKGAKPHEIRPRSKRALRFVMDGRVMFATVVHHPGNRGSRWFSDTWTSANVRRLMARFVGR